MRKCLFLGLFVILLCGACGLIPQRLTECSASRPCATGFLCNPETSMCMANGGPDAMSPPDLASSPDLSLECTKDCIPCLQHDDCQSKVCDSYRRFGTTGTCVPATDVIYVDNRGVSPCGPGGNGETLASALCSLSDAVARIDGVKKRVIRVMPSGRDYGALTVSSRAVSIFGPAGQGGDAELAGSMSTDVLSISAGARVVIDGLDINRGRVGVSCRGGGTASITVRRSHIGHNSESGIQINDCLFEADRVMVHENRGGALFITGTRMFSVTNSFLIRNHSMYFSPVKFVVSAAGTFQFNTVVENVSDTTAGVSCGDTVVEIRNSIVFKNSMEGTSQLTSCEIANTVVGRSNSGKGILLDPVFAPMPGNDFILDPERNFACCIDQAAPGLREDYFGTARPRGLAADLGAHEAR